MKKTLLTKKFGVIEIEIDGNLQINNNYVERGMYLINVESGVVWGFDAEKYEFKDNEIIKKTIN